MTVQSGSWSGTNPIVLSYQWKRCDTSGANCAAISGATAQTYSPAAADVGATLRIAVTATNSSGTATALSDPSGVVSAVNAPLNQAAPSISGTSQQGATLTAVSGSWSGATPISYGYLWGRCDAQGANCVTIGGATGQTYVLTASDVGHTVRVQVTATNTSGSTSALSGSSAVIASPGNAPVNTAVPTLSGTLLQGSTITISKEGTWQGATPLSFAFAWQRCDVSGNNCKAIAGASSATYTLVRDDVANRIRGVVTASNSLGSTTAYSGLSAVIGSTQEPVNTGLPTINGTASVGQKLTASNGNWTGKTPFQFFYQWARGNAGGGYDPIAQATGQTYVVTTADLGHPLYVQVKAQNSYGPAFATSAPTAAVTNVAPAAGAIPVASVSLPDRLVISKVAFSPGKLTSRNAFQARFRVTDSAGHPVQGALVYALGLPYSWVLQAGEQPTGSDGWATITIRPSANMPLGHGAMVIFVRARKAGDSLLAGVSTRRLVQVLIR